MIKARYLYNSYFLSLFNLHQNDEKIVAKFDTGATDSFFTLGAITGIKDVLFVNEFANYIFTLPNIPYKELTSATGNTVKAIKVNANNIVIENNLSLQLFDFLLVLDVSYQSKLIGDDFISSCEFTHNPDSCIKINMNVNNYIQKHNQNQTVPLFDVYNMLNTFKCGLNKYRISIKVPNTDRFVHFNMSASNPKEALLSVSQYHYKKKCEIELASDKIYNACVELHNNSRHTKNYYNIKFL